jgi:hypothetical protein
MRSVPHLRDPGSHALRDARSLVTGPGAAYLGTLEIDLGPKDLEAIEAAVPATAIAGTRYDAHQMSVLDGERAPRAG